MNKKNINNEEQNRLENYFKTFTKNVEVDMIDLKNPNRHKYDNSYYHRFCYNDNYLSRFGDKYTKKFLLNCMYNPKLHEKELREISRYLYATSPQYKRTINYFANMCPLDYIIRPFKFDAEKYNKDNGKTFKSCYKKACDYLEVLNFKHEMNKAKLIAWREDVFYGYIYKTKDSAYIRPLNPDYCKISGICDGCYKYAFDFSYFDIYSDTLEIELNNYGDEFKEKYNIYKNDRTKRWQELEHSNEFCLKISEDIDYPLIPLLGTLPAIYDIEDYKNIKLSSSELENYKALGLEVPINEDGLPTIDENIMRNYYDMILNVLPKNVGLYMLPTSVKEINFEKSNTTSDEVSEAVKNYWNDVGVSSLLFGGDNQSSTSLKISLVADETLAFNVNRQIERNINRLLKSISGSVKFQVSILDVSYYHQKDMHDLYIKDAQYGIPTKTSILASLGFNQDVVDGMSFMENDFLDLISKFVPLQSSYTSTSTSTIEAEENNGRPTSEELSQDLTDAGEITSERD